MRIIAIVTILIAVGAATLAYAFPAAAATACPRCYGFTSIGDGIYVEEGMANDHRAAVVGIVGEARNRVKAFYGELKGKPRILICETEDCYRPIGGGSRGQAILDWALVLSPQGTNAIIAAHEISHIELHHRIGLINTWYRAVPQWFDEGLAADVSGDPRYLSQSGKTDRCLREPGTDLPTSRSAWVESARTQELYARAACRVDRWINLHGGPAGIVRLAQQVSDGRRFDDAAR